jgi:hypothetical protein
VSRRSHRNRGAAKARRAPSNPGGVTLSGDQLTALLAAGQQAAQLATPLPRPPSWSTDPFGPGTPLRPSPINAKNPATGRAEPRLFELPISTNLNVNTAPFVPWKILSDAADMPLFRKCIERRKSVCDLDFVISVDPKAVAREAALSGQHEKDIEATLRRQYTADIARCSDWLQEPDRKNGYDWGAWTRQLMENRLVYDATVVYPKLTFGGDVFAFEVLDGSTVKPLLDEYGGRPLPPFPFAQQVLWGFPRGEFVADTVTVDGQTLVPGGMASDQLLYERTIVRPKTPYGMSATEIALLDGILWMRRMGWLLAEYTEGVTGAMIEVGPEVDWTVEQWKDYARGLNDMLRGDASERLAFSMLPPGTKAALTPEVAERYKPDMDLFLVKLVAGDFGLPASEVGFTEAGALGASFHEGEEDILNRQTRRPDADWLGRIATRLMVRHQHMPDVLAVQVLGLESEDEAAADAVALSRLQSGRTTLNQDNARRGEPPYDFPEADMPMLQTGRGVVFLEGSSAQGPPGTLIGPAIADPMGNAEPGTVSGNGRQVALGGGAPAAPDDDDEEPPAPAAKSVERAALRKWLAKHPSPPRPFACKALTASDLGELAADPRVTAKADDAAPKALSATGRAGSGTFSW